MQGALSACPLITPTDRKDSSMQCWNSGVIEPKGPPVAQANRYPLGAGKPLFQRRVVGFAQPLWRAGSHSDAAPCAPPATGRIPAQPPPGNHAGVPGTGDCPP